MLKRWLVWVIAVGMLLGALSPAVAQKQKISAPDSDSVAEVLEAGSETVSLGDVLMDEPFDNDDNWPEFEEDDYSGVLDRGAYRMTSAEGFYTWQSGSDTYEDIVLQVETAQNSKSLVNDYGVMCRSDLDNPGSGYYFLISGDGLYGIFRQTDVDEGKEPLVEWEQSRSINQGRDSNTITVVCVGNYLALYVNGDLIAEAHDDELSEGTVGLTVGAYDEGAVDISFDNLVVWAASAGKTPVAKSSAAVTLANYNGEPGAVIAELQRLGLVPKGGSLLFRENRAFFSGQGSFFTPLARRSPQTDVVMAGELTFSVGNVNQYEQCSLTARIGTNASGDATTYVDVAFTNTGELLLIDRFSDKRDAELGIGTRTYDVDRPQHLLFVLMGNRANVFVNGELVLADFEVSERAGTYGITLIGKGPGARCEGRNIWVYQFR